MPVGEARVVAAVLVALPLLAVRLVYTLLSDFANSKDFNLLDPDVWAYLGMAVVEEFSITAVFLVAGVLAPRVERGLGGVKTEV